MVVMGRQQLYCAVQSRSPNHCRMTTEKVQSSVRYKTCSVSDTLKQQTILDTLHLVSVPENNPFQRWQVRHAFVVQYNSRGVYQSQNANY